MLAAIIRRHGPCGLGAARDRFDHFAMLVRAIVFQQLSTKAATTIHGRLLASCCRRSSRRPHALAALTDEQMRTAGISRQKAGYLRDLCEKVSSGAVPLDALDAMTDEEVIAVADPGQGHRPLDGRDVPDLPAAAARRPAARRPRHRQRHPEGLPAAQEAHARQACRSSAKPGGRIAPSPAGTCGAASTIEPAPSDP